MHQLTEEIMASKEWRIRELEALKKIGIIALNEYPLREQQQYYRMCIPYIYAHWEGFVVESFKLLITYLNNEQLDKKNVINELYTFSLQKVLKPLAGKQSFEQSYQFVEKFVMNNCVEKYKSDINQLVNERNSIAHGENGIIIEKNHVSNEIAMLQEAFDMIVLEFENYLSQKLYLKSV